MEISRESEGYEGRLSDLVQAVMGTLRRRWLTLVVVSAAIFALGVVAVYMMTPKYQAAALVRLDPTRNPLDKTAQVVTLSPEAVETEVAVINSADIARSIAKEFQLDQDPEFNDGLNDPANPLTPDERMNVVIGRMLDNLSVSRDKLTYIIGIQFTSIDAQKSAKIANAFADAYLRTKIGSSVGTATKQAEFFQQRLDEMAREVREADAKLAQFRASNGLIGSSAGSTFGTLTDQQIGPLSSQLATAQSEAAAARADLAAAEQQIARGGLDSIAQVRSSQVVADLRRQRAEILRTIGEVEARYGPLHPESISAHDQLKSIDQQITDEANRVVSSLRAAANSASARAGSLSGSMQNLEGQRVQQSRASVMADSLEREATSKRDSYNKLSQMSLEANQATRNSIAQAVIVDSAHPPVIPTAPNKPLLIALAFVLAVSVGTGTIAVQEMLVSGMRSIEDVESTLGIPVLAAVPKVPKTVHPADLLLERPTSLFAESLRIARASILGVRTNRPPQIIAITSALPSEGKTTTALAFARTLAMNNAKTLLIECDVRRAAMRENLSEHPMVPGIVELLHGEASLDDAIVPSAAVPGLDQLLVKSPYYSSEDLFGGGQMEQILEELRGRYEQIVLDLPPLIGLADGRFLAVLADATVLIVRWDATPPDAASSALGWLRSDGANPIGAIYTMVDSSSETIGGLYYSKKYAGYYQAG